MFSSAEGPGSGILLEVLGTAITVDSPLVGRHQLRNVALAVAAAVELREQGQERITAESIERGIRETHWPGRFQVVAARGGRPEYVLDVAHNPAGAWALRAALSAVYGDRLIAMVFGVLRDKAMAEMAEISVSHCRARDRDSCRTIPGRRVRRRFGRQRRAWPAI